MKVLIISDSEGQAGVVRERAAAQPGWRHTLMARLLRRPPQYTYGTFQAAFNQEQMSREAAACARGALAAGATELVVLDGGFIRGFAPMGLVIIPQMLPRGAKLAQGGVPLKVLAAEGWDAAIIIGAHSKSGTRDGVMAHTFSDSSIESLQVNGTEVGEIAVMTLTLGQHGVPVVLVSGDEAACREAQDLLPAIHTVATKRGYGPHMAVSLQVDDACDLLERQTRVALQDVDRAQPLVWPAPFSVRLACKSRQAAKRRAARYPNATMSDTIVFYRVDTAADIY